MRCGWGSDAIAKRGVQYGHLSRRYNETDRLAPHAISPFFLEGAGW